MNSQEKHYCTVEREFYDRQELDGRGGLESDLHPISNRS